MENSKLATARHTKVGKTEKTNYYSIY